MLTVINHIIFHVLQYISYRQLLYSYTSSFLLPFSLSHCSTCSGYNQDKTEWLQGHKCIRTCSQLELVFHALLWIAAEQSTESEHKPLLQITALCMSCVKVTLSVQLCDWGFLHLLSLFQVMDWQAKAVTYIRVAMKWVRVMYCCAAEQLMLHHSSYYTAALQWLPWITEEFKMALLFQLYN